MTAPSPQVSAEERGATHAEAVLAAWPEAKIEADAMIAAGWPESSRHSFERQWANAIATTQILRRK